MSRMKGIWCIPEADDDYILPISNEGGRYPDAYPTVKTSGSSSRSTTTCLISEVLPRGEKEGTATIICKYL